MASVPLSCVYSDLDLYDFTLYASIYFQREKSRLFHTFSPRELVSFTGRIPLQPLHPLPPLLVPVVLDLERKVLMWMNVVMVEESEAAAASAEEQRLAVLEQIVYQSVGSQEVFDEAVCFVMKQSNDNPDPDSEVARPAVLVCAAATTSPVASAAEVCAELPAPARGAAGRGGRTGVDVGEGAAGGRGEGRERVPYEPVRPCLQRDGGGRESHHRLRTVGQRIAGDGAACGGRGADAAAARAAAAVGILLRVALRSA